MIRARPFSPAPYLRVAALAVLLAAGAARADQLSQPALQGVPVAPATPAESTPPTRVRPIASETRTASGQPIVFPQGPGRVVVSHYEIAPGAALPLHHHPYPRFAYVLQGRLAVTDTDTGQTFAYKAGDVVIEVIGQKHFGATVGEEAVKLLVIDTLPLDAEGNTVLDQ